MHHSTTQLHQQVLGLEQKHIELPLIEPLAFEAEPTGPDRKIIVKTRNLWTH